MAHFVSVGKFIKGLHCIALLYCVVLYMKENKSISIKKLKDVGMTVPKSRETRAVYIYIYIYIYIQKNCYTWIL